jgi:hypothetical protein
VSRPFRLLRWASDLHLARRPIPVNSSLLGPGVTRAELIDVILTGLTIVIGTLALIVGVVAIWGGQAIVGAAREKANEAARQAIEQRVQEYFDSEEFKERLAREVQPPPTPATVGELEVHASGAMSQSDSLEVEQTGKVGEEYPEKGGADGHDKSGT